MKTKNTFVPENLAEKLAEALKTYLSAGSKEERLLASKYAKSALSLYYGENYKHVNKGHEFFEELAKQIK